MLEPSPLLSGLVNFLLTYAIHSTIVIAAVWLLVTAARWMSDSTRDALWKLALLGPLLTTSVQMAAGIEPVFGALQVDTGLARAGAAPTPPAPADGITVRRHTVITDGGSYTFVVENDPARAGAGSEPTTPQPPAKSPVWPWALVGLWGLGALVSLGRVGLGVLRLRRTLRGREQVLEDPVLESFLALCQQAQLGRKVRLTAAPGLETPVAVWRSEICLPTRALTELAPRQIHAVLAHELGHLQRRDPMWMAAVAVVEAIFFFQPLNRGARRRLQETAEFLCDDWAVRHTGSGEYLATSLARVASWQGACVATPLAPGVMRPGRPFVRRVNRLLDPSRERDADDGGPTRVGLVLGLTGATVWLAPAVVQAEPEARPVVAQRVELDTTPTLPEPVGPSGDEDEGEDEHDDVAVIVVPDDDDCCGHEHGHRRGHAHGFGMFGGSSVRFWGAIGDPDFDFDFDLQVVVPDVRVEIDHGDRSHRGHHGHHGHHGHRSHRGHHGHHDCHARAHERRPVTFGW